MEERVLAASLAALVIGLHEYLMNQDGIESHFFNCYEEKAVAWREMTWCVSV